MEFTLFQEWYCKSRLKGYRHGKVEYETSLNTTLYNRDFLGLEWGTIVLQNPQNLTAYCLLDRDFEYQVYDIVAKERRSLFPIIPVNHKSLSDADFPPTTEKAIKTLMENNFWQGTRCQRERKLIQMPAWERCEKLNCIGKIQPLICWCCINFLTALTS